MLGNAHVAPLEAELLQEIHTLEDLLKYVEAEGERTAIAKSIYWKMIRCDFLKRRSLPLGTLRYFSRKLVHKFRRR
jgi:hypothetical protein